MSQIYSVHHTCSLCSVDLGNKPGLWLSYWGYVCEKCFYKER